MERRGMSIAPDELQEKIDIMLQDETIPLRLRKAMRTAAIVCHDDDGATTDMVRSSWQREQIAPGIALCVIDDGRVFIEITNEHDSRSSFSPLPHDSLGHSLAHQEWEPERELTKQVPS